MNAFSSRIATQDQAWTIVLSVTFDTPVHRGMALQQEQHALREKA